MGVSDRNTEGLLGLAAWRKRRGLIQQELADLVGLHRITIANYETGAQDPKLSVTRRLAVALDCTVADLVTAPAEEAQANG